MNTTLKASDHLDLDQGIPWDAAGSRDRGPHRLFRVDFDVALLVVAHPRDEKSGCHMPPYR
jgi:hypothetical protein